MSKATEEAKKVELAEQPEQPRNILDVITQAVENYKDLNVEKMERLLAMYERTVEREAAVAYKEAMARVQAGMPQFGKSGEIVVKGEVRSKYAKLEDIDKVIRPMLAAEGFSLSLDSESTDGKLYHVSCTVSHRQGHSETKSVLLPPDTSGAKNAVQAVFSTIVGYAHRQLVKMHFNIIETGIDTDGTGEAGEFITEDQAKDIQALIDEVKADKNRFLKYVGVGSVSEIRKGDFERVIKALEDKRRKE